MWQSTIQPIIVFLNTLKQVMICHCFKENSNVLFLPYGQNHVLHLKDSTFLELLSQSRWLNMQARSQDRFWGGAGPPKMDSWIQKWTFWTFPLNPLQKPQLWPILWLKVDLLADLGWCITSPGYGPVNMFLFVCLFLKQYSSTFL